MNLTTKTTPLLRKTSPIIELRRYDGQTQWYIMQHIALRKELEKTHPTLAVLDKMADIMLIAIFPMLLEYATLEREIGVYIVGKKRKIVMVNGVLVLEYE